MKKIIKSRKKLIIISVILSILLYLAGVLSGLYANKMIEKKTQEEIDFIKNYVDVLTAGIETIQVQESFTSGLSPKKACEFSALSYNDLEDRLSYFWESFPYRIEEYERYNKVSEEYLALKESYTKLSIRAWVMAKNNYKKCNKTLIPVLYFYSKECATCIKQGEELDGFKQEMETKGKKVIVFTIDFNSDEQIVKLIKSYYDITDIPAVIIQENVLQKELVSKNELMETVE
ncbi:MAG: hypothetical protein KKF44_06010 [Nanoarchaeota archaeon]|nr:hypothetical protein [Nanoarchaeota archaeon]